MLLGIVIGVLIGLLLPNVAKNIKVLGDIFLNFMFTLVVPLVFFSISSAVGNMIDMKRLGNILSKTILVFITTGIFAGILMITVVKIFPPALGFDGKMIMSKPEGIKSLNDIIVLSLTVPDFPQILSRNNILPLIIFSIFLELLLVYLGVKKALLVN